MKTTLCADRPQSFRAQKPKGTSGVDIGPEDHQYDEAAAYTMQCSYDTIYIREPYA
jgi:hypothetical protein